MRDLELFLGLQGDPCIRDDCTWCPGLPALLRATAACSGNNTQDRPWYAACQRCLTQNGKTGRNHLVAIGCESYRLVQERVLRTRHVCPRPVVCSAVEGSKLKSAHKEERGMRHGNDKCTLLSIFSQRCCVLGTAPKQSIPAHRVCAHGTAAATDWLVHLTPLQFGARAH